MTTAGLRFQPTLLILVLAWMGALGTAVADAAELQKWVGRFYLELGITETECPPEIAGDIDDMTRLICGHTDLKLSEFQRQWQRAEDRFAGEGVTIPSTPPSWQQRGGDYSRLHLCCGGGFEVRFMRDRKMVVTLYSDNPSWSPRPAERNARAIPDHQAGPYIAGGGGVTNPVLKRKRKPHYPEAAGWKKIGAKVVLEGIVGHDGLMHDLIVVSSTKTDCGFEAAALAAVNKWRYKPGELSGQPVDVYFTVTIEFVPPWSRHP